MNIQILYTKIAIAGFILMLISGACYFSGARFNITKSIPVGLYWVDGTQVQKGDYVIFCPPNNDIFVTVKKRGYINGGFCSGNLGYMMKKVVALEGSAVVTTDAGVMIDGKLLAHSKLQKVDPAGRELPRYHFTHYIISDSELLLMSDTSETSFDGRYFGPINRSQIQNVILPILTW